MPEAATAAPPASTATPSTPAAAPASAPAATPDAGASPSLLDQFGQDVGALDEPAQKPDADKGGKPDAGEPVTAPPGDKPAGDKAPAKPAADAQPPKPVKAAQLREQYESLKKEKSEVLMPKIQTLEARIKELESKGPDELKSVSERATAAEKRRDELEQHIRFVDYQRSAEFQQKYALPYKDAYERALADFSQLQVRVPDGKDEVTDEPKFTTRQATADDLLYLANLDLSKMDEQAEALFGRSAPRVIRHVEKVRELSDAQNRALADAQKRSGEWVKDQQKRGTEFQQHQVALWNDLTKQIQERFPAMFKPVEGDTEGNALLEKGFALADRLFKPTKETAPKTVEERVQLHALLYNKIANHDRLARRVRMQSKEIEDLKKELSEYEASRPPAPGATNAKPLKKSFLQEAEEEIAALDVR